MSNRGRLRSTRPPEFTVGDVFWSAASIFTRNLPTLFCITLIVYVPIAVNAGLVHVKPVSKSPGTELSAALVDFMLLFIATAAVIHAVARLLRDQRAGVRESLSDTLKQAVPVLLIGFVTMLVWWMPVAFTSIALLARQTGLGPALLFVLLPLGVVVSLYFSCVIWAAFPAVVIERMGVFDAMRRSAQLTSGHKWRILGLVFLVFAILLIAGGASVVVSRTHTTLGLVLTVITYLVATPFAATISAVGFHVLCRVNRSAGADEPGPDPRGRSQLAAGLVILLVAAVWPLFVPMSDRERVPRLLQAGIKKVQQGDHDGAIDDFTELLRIQPAHATAYYNRGNAKLKKGDYDAAISDFSVALRIDPKLAPAYTNRGVAKKSKGDLDGAIEDYTVALRINPALFHGCYNRGIARLAKGEYAGAIEDCTAALRTKPKHAGAYHIRGTARLAKADYAGAIQDCTDAIRMNPRLASAYLVRGAAKRGNGDDAGAIADYTEVLRLDPRVVSAYADRGAARFDTGDYVGVIDDCTSGLRLDPTHALCCRLRAYAHYHAGMWDEAAADLLKYCELDRSEQDYPRLFLWLVHARSSPPDATRELRAYLETRRTKEPGEWYLKVAAFLVNELTEAKFLAATKTQDAKTTRERRCEGYFYAGVKRHLADDLATARDYFGLSLATGCDRFIEYAGAKGELKRLGP